MAAIDTDSLEEKIVKLKSLEFPHHSKQFHRVNNGSFGSAANCVLEVQKGFRGKWLAQPDQFLYDRENGFWPQIKRSILTLAPIVNCPTPYHHHLCLVENATTAGNIIATALMWKFVEGIYHKDDVVVLFNTTYYAIQSSFRNTVERVGGKLVFLQIPFSIPIQTENGEDLLVETLKMGLVAINKPIRAVVLDHISSMPSMVFPLKRMIQTCRAKGVDHVIVDAAHAIGNVSIDLEDLDADFYFSNCHKWLFNPAAVAFLYSRQPFITDNTEKSSKLLDLHHPIAGHLFNQGILAESAYTGTKDYSPYFCVTKGLEFASTVVSKFLIPQANGVVRSPSADGLEELRVYNHSRLMKFCSMLTTSWATKLAVPAAMSCSMAMISLPPEIRLKDEVESDAFRNLLRAEYNLEVPVLARDELAYIRLSHQVYNTTADYLALRDAILPVVNRLKCGEKLDEMLRGLITHDWNLSALKIF